MKKPVSTEKVYQFKSMRDPLNLQAAIRESNRCLLCLDAPCCAGCPAGTDPAKFIRQIRFYNYKGAARTIRNNNILGSVCAFICPVEKLCEKECSVKALEDPINISGLQQFASEYGKNHFMEPLEKSKKCKGKIAIAGAGPAGIGCASELAKLDYEVIIFERENHAGGVTWFNIPEFRLPLEALDYDIENLISQGVEIRYNSPMIENEAINQLLQDGYDAVFISTGLSTPFRIELFEGYNNAVDYYRFLRQIKFDKNNVDLKNKNIAVIGGGSVAIDSAVSAKAAGANKVYLISLEHLDELPADAEEINLARSMNIIFKAGCQITSLVSEENQIKGLKGIETEWMEAGKYSPENSRQIQGTEFSLNVDLVVQAIGTRPGLEISALSNGMKIKGKGVIEVNDNFETNITGVFAGGDVVNGGATVVQAVGEGKRAAKQIDKYLKWRNEK